MTTPLPIGVVIRTIGADPATRLDSARRLDEAGYASAWAWDHLIGPIPENRLPEYVKAPAEAGRRRSDQLVLVEVNEGDWLAKHRSRTTFGCSTRSAWERWQRRVPMGLWF